MYWHLVAEYDQFVLELSEDRKASSAKSGDKRKAKLAERTAAAEASAQAADAWSTQHGKKVKLTDFGGFQPTHHSNKREFWNEKLRVDTARFFLGEAVADAKLDSVLLHQLLGTAMAAGAEGFKLAEPRAKPLCGGGASELTLLTRQQLGGTVLKSQSEYYIKKLKTHKSGKLGTKNCGFSLVSDGTTRFGRGVVDIAFVFTNGDVVFWELKDTSGTRKSNVWMTEFILECVKSPDFPFDVRDLVTIVMDGACRTAFAQIEEAFRDDEALPNVVCQWCSCHSWNLLLKAVADIDGIDTLITDVKSYITFVRNHDKPRDMLRKVSSKGLVRWVETRFGTVFLCFERLLEVRQHLLSIVGSEDWAAYYGTLSGDVKEKATEFVTMSLDVTFWNRIRKVCGAC